MGPIQTIEVMELQISMHKINCIKINLDSKKIMLRITVTKIKIIKQFKRNKSVLVKKRKPLKICKRKIPKSKITPIAIISTEMIT
jgi:hypothetical protein